MSEPELPGLPPPPVPPWWRRPLRLATRPKLPGWAVLLLLALREIPDWKGRIDFWLDTVKEAGGYAGSAATVINSPYFSLGLAGIGVLWLAFAGEPQRGVQRHPWLPYFGWTFVGLIFGAIALTAGWGAMQVSIQREVGKTDEKIQKDALSYPIFWHLTEYNRNALGLALDQIPADKRFDINVKCLPDSISRTFVEDLGKVIEDHHWTIKANCFFSDVRPDLLGMYIGVRKDTKLEELPPNARTLGDILHAAEIPWDFAYGDAKMKDDEFYIVVGNGPKP